MGGIFKSPSPPAYVAETTDTSEEDATAKQEEIARRKRGVSGTINTTYRGVLSADSANNGLQRKVLLGE